MPGVRCCQPGHVNQGGPSQPDRGPHPVFRPRLENLWVTPVSGRMGNRIENVGKPRCFNGFQVALNMLKVAFWSPAEPTWDFKVRAATRSKGHFAGSGWLADRCPFGDHLEPANDGSCSISDRREGTERFLFFLLRKVFCFGFQRVAGAKPPPGAAGFTATDSPTNSSEEPSLMHSKRDRCAQDNAAEALSVRDQARR